MLNPDNIKTLKGYILNKFEKSTLTSFQKDNLASATIDRLLSDKAFSGLLGDVSGGITSGIQSLET